MGYHEVSVTRMGALCEPLGVILGSYGVTMGFPGVPGGSLGALSLIGKNEVVTTPGVLPPPNRYCKQYLRLTY